LLVDLSIIDAARAIDILADSNIAAVSAHEAPHRSSPRWAGASGAVTFDVDTMRKDLRHMAVEAAAHGPHSRWPTVRSVFDRASRAKRWRHSVAYPAYWIAAKSRRPTAGRIRTRPRSAVKATALSLRLVPGR
jgi:hypothetical protein